MNRARATRSTSSPTPWGDGYWVFTTRGRAVTFGDARHHGDMPPTANLIWRTGASCASPGVHLR